MKMVFCQVKYKNDFDGNLYIYYRESQYNTRIPGKTDKSDNCRKNQSAQAGIAFI
jgi:hypothetical protein